VMVDLRGHGQTKADHITYGVAEARDLMQLTTYLQERKLCGKTVGVFGTSYGATTALLFAGADPRVTAVVAVAPFASLRQEVPHYARVFAPIPGWFMSDQDFQEVVDAMGRQGGFDPDAANAVAAIRKTSAHVRLFHGTWDLVVPSEASKELAAAAPERTELTLMTAEGHLSLCLDLFGELRAETRAWFDRYLESSP
jgi:pimeloyl-ACP methyl ester carboxylesterase